ncbi:MAG: hypothetical protein ACOC22_03670 [bacterium]
MEDVLRFEYEKGVQKVFPTHNFVKNWLFTSDEKEEAELAHFMAVVAEKNGMSVNDMHHLFPYVLRMLKSDIQWSK